MIRTTCLRSRNLIVEVALVLAVGSAAVSRAADGWTDTRAVGPFVCRANFPLTNVERLVQELAELQNELVRCLGIRPPDRTIELYLFDDEPSYRAYLRRYLPRIPYRRALYVQIGGQGMVFAFRSSQFEVDLRHECTHALLHAVLPMVPLWLDEGLAEYFEVETVDRPFRNPHLSSVRWLSRLGFIHRMESLEKYDDLQQMGNAEYRACWAWVHFILHSPYSAHEELVRFLGDIQDGAPPGNLSQRLHQRIPDLPSRFAHHFRSWKQ